MVPQDPPAAQLQGLAQLLIGLGNAAAAASFGVPQMGGWPSMVPGLPMPYGPPAMQQNAALQQLLMMQQRSAMRLSPDGTGVGGIPPAGQPREYRRRRRDTRVEPAQQEQRPAGCCLLAVLREAPGDFRPDANEIFAVFSQFGVVEKLSVFKKQDAPLQVLVQMAEPAQASLAISYLNGRQVELSKGDRQVEALMAIVPSSHRQLSFSVSDEYNRAFAEINELLRSAAARETDLASCVASMLGRPLSFLWGEMIPGTDGWLIPRQEPSEQGRIVTPKTGGAVQGQVGDCVLITGVPQDDDVEGVCPQVKGLITAQNLMGFCGMYGDVVAVKLLHRFNDRALVQYSCKDDAQAACEMMHSDSLFGRSLAAKPSKHSNAQNWSGARSGLEHRTCVSGTRPGQRQTPARPPFTPGRVSDTVQFWGLPSSATEEDVAVAVGAVGIHVTEAKAAEAGMMRVILGSTEEAFVVICLLNGRTMDVGSQEVTACVCFAP
eukprot:TRINITY_DN43702_c0_g1_i1.p1 TRINITY_DN43702_c0_g1~~TRINITY_DN43702_c0_g1_i1.p1  ORF type:complete len:573 (+),score=145.28 TRINITY_DN43702_c0_g1_i1:247-1719(+)